MCIQTLLVQCICIVGAHRTSHVDGDDDEDDDDDDDDCNVDGDDDEDGDEDDEDDVQLVRGPYQQQHVRKTVSEC